VTEHGGHDPEDLREVARERVRELPGETAGGRIDPASVPREEWLKSRGIRPSGSGGESEQDSSDSGESEESEEDPADADGPSLWDESTHGAARWSTPSVSPGGRRSRAAGG
jgi:hypothetical protein